MSNNQDDRKNVQTVINEFTARGLDESEIIPNVNVLTYRKWQEKGRQVKKGEHGVKIVVIVKDKQDAAKTYPRKTTVFHISQTEEK